jgi:hypothetical protein
MQIGGSECCYSVILTVSVICHALCMCVNEGVKEVGESNMNGRVRREKEEG